MRLEKKRLPLGAILLYVATATITLVLGLQGTKQAMLPAKQTPIIWSAEIAVIIGVLILRSGWARDSNWAKAQAQLGTLANNFYEPRREALTAGFAIGIGVGFSLWWSLSTWSVVLGGVRGGTVARGLLDFEIAALLGAITGGVVGAVMGLAIGEWWERRHRRSRLARAGSVA